MTTNTQTGVPKRELFFVAKPIKQEVIDRALRSLEKGPDGVGDPDRDIDLALIDQGDSEETTTSKFTVDRIRPGGDNAHLIYGTRREDRALPLRVTYHHTSRRDDHYGSVEEVED